MGRQPVRTLSQLRLDPLTGRWVVITLERAGRPYAFSTSRLPVEADPGRPCPFCPGNEEKTPPALETYGPSGQWAVRVVPNLYPAFEGVEVLAVQNAGPVFTQASAGGIHEVFVLAPGHADTWADLSDEHAGMVMAALRDRIADHAAYPALRYTQAIVNQGREAGASLEHPHGQLLGMTFVPGEIAAELAGFARFEGNCLLCATADAEEAADARVLHSDDRVIVLCPFWSGTPYEMLVIPRHHERHLHAAEPPDLTAVATGIRDALAKLRGRLGDVAYNLVFHFAPYRGGADFHWHVHILPKVTSRAGFELGTGVLINLVPPELAALELREARVGV